MKELKEIIQQAQTGLKERLEGLMDKGMSKEQYRNYLSMQYHMTDGVQKHFLGVLGHESLKNKTELRKFLFRFSMEEEPHYLVALNDIKNLGMEPTERPLDVKLWKLYFLDVLKTKPFMRLGAASILENITSGLGALIDQLFAKADYITKNNTIFVTIHRHEDLPHGEEILEVLERAKLSEEQYDDLLSGAKDGMTLFLRCFDWAMTYKG